MQRLEDAIRNATATVGDTTFVAIDGMGGSGKTTLARLIAQHLDVTRLHVDDLSSGEPYDWMARLLNEVVGPIGRGAKAVSFLPVPWWGQAQQPECRLQVGPVMVVEGVGVLHADLRQHWGVRVFVDTPPDVCLERGITRDLAAGKPREQIASLWQQWHAQDKAHVARHDPKSNAHLVLDGTRPFEDQL